jgi:hypothetical protein
MSIIYTGLEFNTLYKDTKFYKITNSKENHRGLIYTDGLNIDNIYFKLIDNSMMGGIYFAEEYYIINYIDYGIYIREVIIPDDACVCVEHAKFRADKLFFKPRILIEDFEGWSNNDFCELATSQDGSVLRLISKPNQTEKICLLAVQQNGYALEHVHIQTDKICIAAVQQIGLALKFVNNKTYKICLLAIKTDGMALKYVPIKTEDLCLIAIRRHTYAFICGIQTEATCHLAIKKDPFMIKYIRIQTPELCEMALKLNPLVSKYIKNFN